MLPASYASRLDCRIMIVSDRPEVVAELEPILGATQHLSLCVPDGAEALRSLRDGVVPDLVISDLGSGRSLEEMEYVWRFRAVNRLGRHFVIVEDGAPFSEPGPEPLAWPRAITPLRRPFQAAEVRETVENAISRMDRDIRSLRGEVWREIDQLQQAVRDVQRDTVNALAATIAARDPYMHGHATRVAALCRRIASLLRLRAEDAALLETAALLHEIGKASVPVELLHRTGPLSPAELERVRAHAAAGAEIVRQVPSLRRAAPLIEQQGTEHRDLGLHLDCGSIEFLLTGVLRAVDAYDAMTHARSFREALPQDCAEHALEQAAGTLYHPAAVRALLRALGSGDAPARAA